MKIGKATVFILGILMLQASVVCSQCMDCYTNIQIKERCKGKGTVLEAETNGNIVSWSTDGGDSTTILSREGFQTTVIPQVKTRYVATTTHFLENKIINGSFDSTQVTFTTEYTPGSSGTFGSGDFAVGKDPSTYLSAYVTKQEHTGNNGYMMIVDGSDAFDPYTVWSDSVEVKEGEEYRFSMAAANIHENFLGSGDKSAYNRPELAVYINDQLEHTFILPEDTSWNETGFLWNSDLTGKAEITILDLDTNVKENDFVLDDLKFQQVEYTQAVLDIEPCGDLDVFSPNGDGNYDSYFIDGSGTAKIFDTEGKLIIELPLPVNWDGRDKNGNIASTGYYAIIINGQEVRRISIIR